eukprot:g62459.t1
MNACVIVCVCICEPVFVHLYPCVTCFVADLFVIPYFSQAGWYHEYYSSNMQASYFFWGWNLHFTFLNNRLEVNEGETVNMATLLGALSCRVAPEQVYFTFSRDLDKNTSTSIHTQTLTCWAGGSLRAYKILNSAYAALQNGRFEFTTKPGQAITTFSQANLSAGLVRFVHPGGDLEPSYNVTASDGQYTLTEPAKIDFNFQRPFFILNQLAVREGERVVLTSAMVTVGDGDSSPSEILIQVSSLEEGIFSALSFTYALLLAGSVSFTHSGSEFPPRFSLSLSDGTYTEAACPTKISFTNVNDAPTILKNQFTINEGQALTLTSSDLSATDPDDDDRSLTFQVVTALHCFFQRASGPGVPIVSFTQGEVQDGTIKVVHDGSELFPLVALRVVDAQQAASSSKASVITFSNLSDPPFFLNAEVNITEGETLVLSASMLSASDVDNNDINLIFTVEAATHAYFRVASSSVSSPVTSFLQKFILEGRVSLVHDGSEGVPNITLTVSDGGWSSPPRQLQVHFTGVDDPPVFLSRPQLALIEGQSKTLSNLEFMVWDDDTPDTAVILALENTQRCSFYVNNTQVMSFPLFYLNHGWVSIIPDGSSFAPQFEVTVGDATTVSLPLSALVAFTPVNDFPVLVRNLLIIAQGGSVLIGSSQLEASDEETASLQLLFSVTNLRAGQFKKNGQSVHTFLQAELVAGAIWFVHDNSEVPPSYDVIVSDGAALSVPSPVQVTFTQVNDAPYLINNALTIEEGQTVQITSDQLKAADPEQGAAGSLLFSVSNVLHLQFYYYNQSQTALTSFFQDEVLNGSVFATHDGSNYAPSYMLQVSDGAASSGPQKCTVAFSARNDVPVIVRNVLFIAEGGKAVLGTANLEASDEETAFVQLRFSVIDARAGWFETGGLTVSSFTQQQLAAGYVSFVHDGSEQAPSYEIVVSDGSSLSAPSQVQITFTQVNDAPYLINNALTIEEGQTVQITSDQLKAADPEQGAAGSLLFSVSNVLHLRFHYYNQSQTALTSFLQGDVFNGSVLATHDGSDNVPSYMLQVSDGAASSPSQSALVSFVPVPDPPVLEANLLFIAQRQRISVSSLQLRATDPDSPSNRILFDILGLLHGRFERLGVFGVPIVTFSMQDVSAGVIFFEHDGSEVAPSYWVAVSDGTTTLPPSLALVDYANVNDPPTLVHNSFIITEGQTTVVTINMLQGTDPDDDDEDILVEISESKQINFFQVAEPALSILSFSQADILAGQLICLRVLVIGHFTILLSHDGSNIPPAFRLTFIDPHGAASATVPAAVEFVAVNDPPVLTRNTLTIAEGERLVLSQDELAASDPDNHEQDLLFTVEHVVAGQFERLGNPGLAIFRFEQLRVMKGDIIFVAQGNVLPSYNVSVSDGTNATEPSAAIVRFTSLKALAASESMQDRVKNTIIISTISGVVGILFFLFQLYLQYQYQKRFEEGDDGEDPQDKEYYRGVVIPVAQEVFRCMRIKGPFGMISAEDFAAYLGSVRALLTHLSSLEVDIVLPNMNPARRDAFLNEIAYQTQMAVLRDRKKTCLPHFLLPCTYCLPEHPPEWIRENASSIARAVAQALTLGSPQLKRTHSAHSSHSILGPGAKVAPKPLSPLIISSDSGQPASSGEPPALALSSSARAAELPVEVKRKGPRSSWPPSHGGGEPEVRWADLEEMDRHHRTDLEEMERHHRADLEEMERQHRADLEEMKTTIVHLVEETILAMAANGTSIRHVDTSLAIMMMDTRTESLTRIPALPTQRGCSKERAQKFEYESIRTKSQIDFQGKTQWIRRPPIRCCKFCYMALGCRQDLSQTLHARLKNCEKATKIKEPLWACTLISEPDQKPTT